MTKGKILLVEDNDSLGFLIVDNLQEAGYDVTWARDGKQGEDEALNHTYDLCVLDIMLPHQDGFGLAAAIREVNEFIPIIFVTARSMEEDRLKGFEIGGDDYLTKPFSIRELLYRIQVFIRRTKSEPVTHVPSPDKIGHFSFCHELLELRSPVETFSMTQREADLLHVLIANKDAIVKRSEILEKLWGEDDYFKGRSLDVFISRLRKYLRSDPRLEIRNLHGVGFSLKQLSR